MSKRIYLRLQAELSEAQNRRHKLDLLKISFVTALLGVGGVDINISSTLHQLLYLAPLVAIFFDLLVMGQHYSIRRIGAFLRNYPENLSQAIWEKYVSQERDKIFKIGSRGFTVIAILASATLLWDKNKGVTEFMIIWYFFVSAIYLIVVMVGSNILSGMDSVNRETFKTLEKDIKSEFPDIE